MKHRNKKFPKSNFSRAYLFFLPSLIGVLVLFVIPYLDVIRRSFLDGTGQRFVGVENYQVLGMLTREIQGAVFSAKDLHATRLDHMTIETSEDSTLSMLEQAVEWKIGFAGTAFDYRFINSVVGLLSIGLCILLWLWLLRLMVREWKNYRKQHAAQVEYYKGRYRIAPDYVKGMTVRICFIAGVVLLMVIFLRFHVKIPEDMIPTKWSDFAFWSRWRADKADRMTDWVRCEKYAPELEYLGKSARAVVCFVISYLCYLLIRILKFGRERKY